MAVGRMMPDDQLESDTRSDFPDEIVKRCIARQPVADGPARLQVPDGLAVVYWFAVRRFQSQHINAKTRIDRVEFHL